MGLVKKLQKGGDGAREIYQRRLSTNNRKEKERYIWGKTGKK